MMDQLVYYFNFNTFYFTHTGLINELDKDIAGNYLIPAYATLEPIPNLVPVNYRLKFDPIYSKMWKIEEIKEDEEIKENSISIYNNALSLLKEYSQYTNNYLFNKFSSEQQEELITYLDQLQYIVDGHNNDSIPIKPGFLK